MCTRVVMTWIAPALAVVFGLLVPRAAQGQELMILHDIPGVTIQDRLSLDPATGDVFFYEYTPFERLATIEGTRSYRAYLVLLPGDPSSAIDVTELVRWSVEPYYELEDGQENLYRVERNTVHYRDAWIQDGENARFRVNAELYGMYKDTLGQWFEGSIDEARAQALADIAQLMQEVMEHAVGLIPSAAQLREKTIDAIDRAIASGIPLHNIKKLLMRTKIRSGNISGGAKYGRAGLLSDSTITFSAANAKTINDKGFFLPPVPGATLGAPNAAFSALANELFHLAVDKCNISMPKRSSVNFYDANGQLYVFFKLLGLNGKPIDRNGDGMLLGSELGDYSIKIEESLSTLFESLLFDAVNMTNKLMAANRQPLDLLNTLRNIVNSIKMIRDIFGNAFVDALLEKLGLIDADKNNVPDFLDSMIMDAGLTVDGILNYTPPPSPPDGGGGGPDIVNPENPEPGDLPGQNPPTAPGDPQLPEPSTPPLALFLGTVICV